MPRPINRGRAQMDRHDPLENAPRGGASEPILSVGRGWEVHSHEVTLEPEMERPSPDLSPVVTIDDTRIPNRFRSLFTRSRPLRNFRESIPLEPPKSLLPQRNHSEQPNLVSIRAYLPSELKNVAGQYGQLISSLSNSVDQSSFEIVGTSQSMVFQITCTQRDQNAVLAHLSNHLPQLSFRVSEDRLKKCFPPSSADRGLAVDIGLSGHWFLPIRTVHELPNDPLIPLISIMDDLRENEAFCFQVMFARTRKPWQRTAAGTVFDLDGKPRFTNLRPYIPEIKAKLSAPLLTVCSRILTLGDPRERSVEIARQMGAYLKQFAAQDRNTLIPLRSDDTESKCHVDSLLSRTTLRKGALLSLDELTGLIRFPTDAVVSQKLERDNNASRAAPDFASKGELLLGVNEHNEAVKEIRLSPDKRVKHMHLVGASGSGKSTLLTQMMCQDLALGSGFACFDPHGDLIDAVLDRVPQSRIADVVLFDPSDEEFPVGFNILSAHSELEKTLLSSDLVGIFRRFATSWGDQMNSVLANSILAFLQSNRGGSLVDLRKFLIDKHFRQEFLDTVDDDEIRYYWEREFPELRGKPYAPLLTRLDTFLRSRLVRNIVAQRDNKLDFRTIMDERKILLVKLSLGAIGEENAYLLGSLLVAKIYMAALSRQEISEEQREPFYLYLDEAHHFLTPSMNQILSGVRKYKIGLTVAHQQLAQFQHADADVLASLLSNTYTRVCFRVDDGDAERLAKGFSFFTSDHLKNLGVGQAIARFEQSQFSFNLRTFPAEAVPAMDSQAVRKTILDQSRGRYSRSKAEVEAAFRHHQPENYETSIVRPNPIPEKPPAAEVANKAKTGRGGSHHLELQQVIRRMAENLDFEVEIEREVLDGTGRVDVSLRKDDLQVACEVSVTTADYEIHNAEKCLAAGYDHVFIVVSNRKKLPLIERKLKAEIPTNLEHKVKVCSLMDLLAILQQFAGRDSSIQKVKRIPGDRLNFSEACAALGKAPSTVYRWINEGRIPFYRIGREYQFDRNELLLLGKHDLSGKRKAVVNVEPLKVGTAFRKGKKEQDARYKKLLDLD